MMLSVAVWLERLPVPQRCLSKSINKRSLYSYRSNSHRAIASSNDSHNRDDDQVAQQMLTIDC